jgi:hypothetical protein
MSLLLGFSGIPAIAAVTRFSVEMVCFFGFGSLLLAVFKSFIPFVNFLLIKQDSPTPPTSVAKSVMAKTAVRSAATSWCLAVVIANAAFVGDFLHTLYTNMFPQILWRQSRPPPIIWAPAEGLRKCTARSYCTPCNYQNSRLSGS